MDVEVNVAGDVNIKEWFHFMLPKCIPLPCLGF